MISDLDILRAQLLVTRHGADALVVAQRAGELLNAGDLDGIAVWENITRAVEADRGSAMSPTENHTT